MHKRHSTSDSLEGLRETWRMNAITEVERVIVNIRRDKGH